MRILSACPMAAIATVAALALPLASPAQTTWVPADGGLMDPETGTVWSDAFCVGNFCFTREAALAFAESFDAGGYTDWRIPSKEEIEKACADGGGTELQAFYQNPEFTNRPFWTTDLQGRRFPYLANFVNCSSVAVGAGSTAFVVCARGPVHTRRGGGKKDKCHLGVGTGPLEVYGNATSGCGGTPSIYANRTPVAGDRDFAVTGQSAPPEAVGMLLLGDVRAALPMRFLGVFVNVEPAGCFGVIFIQSLPDGTVQVPLPIPSTMRGAEVFTQLLWFHSACASAPLCATQGLAIRVQ